MRIIMVSFSIGYMTLILNIKGRLKIMLRLQDMDMLLVGLKHDAEGKGCIEITLKRLHALSYHMRSCFWLDFQQLNDIYKYKIDKYFHSAFMVLSHPHLDKMQYSCGY